MVPIQKPLIAFSRARKPLNINHIHKEITIASDNAHRFSPQMENTEDVTESLRSSSSLTPNEAEDLLEFQHLLDLRIRQFEAEDRNRDIQYLEALLDEEGGIRRFRTPHLQLSRTIIALSVILIPIAAFAYKLLSQISWAPQDSVQLQVLLQISYRAIPAFIANMVSVIAFLLLYSAFLRGRVRDRNDRMLWDASIRLSPVMLILHAGWLIFCASFGLIDKGIPESYMTSAVLLGFGVVMLLLRGFWIGRMSGVIGRFVGMMGLYDFLGRYGIEVCSF